MAKHPSYLEHQGYYNVNREEHRNEASRSIAARAGTVHPVCHGSAAIDLEGIPQSLRGRICGPRKVRASCPGHSSQEARISTGTVSGTVYPIKSADRAPGYASPSPPIWCSASNGMY